jgi:glycerate dehydrogenase
MKIVVLDGYAENPGDLSWDGIGRFGELTVYDRTEHGNIDEIAQRLGDAEIVLINKVPVDESVLDACPSIRYIGVLATGYNVVDVAECARRGITVTNVPDYGSQAVAQFAMGLLLEICHHIGHHDRAVHDGAWQSAPDFCFWDYPLIELAGKTLGIVGLGRIGLCTAKMAAAMGMKVIASSPHETQEDIEYVSLDELYRRADVISLHCPQRADTAGMINRESIAKMKDGVILINTSRGGLIAEQDLADALNSGKVSAAGLDVVGTEPIRSDNPLLGAKNCIITPHIAWAARASRQRLMDIAVENLEMYLKGTPINVVTR